MLNLLSSSIFVGNGKTDYPGQIISFLAVNLEQAFVLGTYAITTRILFKMAIKITCVEMIKKWARVDNRFPRHMSRSKLQSDFNFPWSNFVPNDVSRYCILKCINETFKVLATQVSSVFRKKLVEVVHLQKTSCP